MGTTRRNEPLVFTEAEINDAVDGEEEQIRR
jgi:hypothetical protein